MNLARSPRPAGHPGTHVRAICLATALALGLIAGASGVAGASNASKVAQAKKSLLKLSDLPKGWTSSSSGSHSGASGAFPGGTQLASCLGVPDDVINSNPPTAYSRDFSLKNQDLSVSDSVAVSPSAKKALADFNSLASAQTPSCLTTVLNGPAKSGLEGQLPAGETMGTITVSRRPASEFAPDSATFTIFAPITYKETLVNTQITLVDFVKGDEEQMVTLTSVNQDFPAALSKHLTEVADGRI